MVDVDVDDLNDTPLHLATRSGDHEEMLHILRVKQCDPNAIGLYGWAPLHETVAKGDLEGAAILLQHGALPHRRDSVTRDSPLHLAAKCSNTKMLQLLLKHVVDLDVMNKKGEMPIDVAKGDCIKLLEKYGCMKSTKNITHSEVPKMKVTRPVDPFEVKDTGLEAYLITPEEAGLVGSACRRCGLKGQPLPQLTVAVQYNSRDSYSTKIHLGALQDVLIPNQLLLEYTHIYMEVFLQPDVVGTTKQSTEELLLNECLVNHNDNNCDGEELTLLLPLSFATCALYKGIPRNKMDDLSVSFTLHLRKGYWSALAVASANVPLSSAIKMVTPHTIYLTHTLEFLSCWK